MIVAILDTSHFQFVTLATNRRGARAIMGCAWNRHREQTGADTFTFWEDAVQYHEIQEGECLRDGECIFRADGPTTSSPEGCGDCIHHGPSNDGTMPEDHWCNLKLDFAIKRCKWYKAGGQ